MRLLVFGLSLTSSWGNGHATVYRGLLRALSCLGVEITFVEKDVAWYAENRDLPRPGFARVVLYQQLDQLWDLMDGELSRADAVMMGSFFPDGVLLADRLAEHPSLPRLYYDIDTPVTLSDFSSRGETTYLRAAQLPLFDTVLSFTGGPALAELKDRWGARSAHAFYCALDPETHVRTAPDDRYRCRLSYMGTYSADRHDAWEQLFLAPSMILGDQRFLLAGPQYPAMDFPPNVTHYQHLPPSEHPHFYSSSDLTLNITRGPMVRYGYSPSVRLFEAAGCSTCVVSDKWQGLEEIFAVGEEVLVVSGTEEMVEVLRHLTPERRCEIGERALNRALRDHTYAVRAQQFISILQRL